MREAAAGNPPPRCSDKSAKASGFSKWQENADNYQEVLEKRVEALNSDAFLAFVFTAENLESPPKRSAYSES
jgi:hypothetical protein